MLSRHRDPPVYKKKKYTVYKLRASGSRYYAWHWNCFWMHNRFIVSLSLSRFAIARTLFILWSGSTYHTFYKIRCLSVVLRICKSFAIILSHLSLLCLCGKWNYMYCNVRQPLAIVICFPCHSEYLFTLRPALPLPPAKLVYLKCAKLEQFKMLRLKHFNCAEVVLKSNQRCTDCAKVEVYFRYTLNILHLKTNIIQRSYNPHQ